MTNPQAGSYVVLGLHLQKIVLQWKAWAQLHLGPRMRGLDSQDLALGFQRSSRCGVYVARFSIVT